MTLHKKKLSLAIAGVISTFGGAHAIAQDTVLEEVVITGIRHSMAKSLDVKRDGTGIVDAITAEDIGKMPDTNLAESLQRITGVSINRVNGEGSEVTVRGFGGNYNLVTVNGRQMPSANVRSITGNPLDQNQQGVSRSFDFSNLASEGVSGIQVYKTGQANVPTGGIGATINIETIKPLVAGTKLSLGIKAVDDTGGDDITPEVSGLYSWANDEGTLGVAVFGSYQERDSGSRHISVEDWFPTVWGENSAADWGMANANIINEPEIGQVANRPSNIGIGVNEDSRERTNAQITLQFAPSDALTITADASYAQNVKESTATIDGLWHQATVYTDVEFDGNGEAAAPVRLDEAIDGGGGVDFFFQNLSMAVEDSLASGGLNVDWQIRDNFKLNFDVAATKAESGPDGAFGKNSIRMNIAGPVAGWRSWDYTKDFPQASVVIEDDRTSDPNGPNGIFDKPDVGSQVTQEYFSEQITETEQARIDATWDFNNDVIVQFGASYLGTEMTQEYEQGQLELGGWGIGSPGDIPEGLFQQGCTGCQFDENLSKGTAQQGPNGKDTIPLGSVSFSGDAVALTKGLSQVYDYTPGAIPLTGKADNKIEEDILAAYVSADLDGEFAGFATHVRIGARYEYTDVTSTTNQNVPLTVIWESDNDFRQVISNEAIALSEDSSYNNFLPSLDFSMDFTETLKGRASFSQTIARTTYDKMYQSTSVNNPPRPTALGGVGGGSQGNVKLEPLESNNFDLSLEWYYGDVNLLSLGYYQKDVKNFVGTQIVEQSLFDLRDAASGAAGSRSGDAIDELNAGGFTVSERNLFTMTAVLDNPGDFPGGAADFDDSQDFASAVFTKYDVAPNGKDPIGTYGVSQPVNNQTANIYGWEFVSQHWFGESGFGYNFNYTTVEGDIEYDNGSDPSEDQFALEGLSDSANFTLIYENYGFSGRLLYNWRDDYLNQVQRTASGGNRNPEYIEAYSQVDLNLTYQITDNFAVNLDIINLTEEEIVHYGRSKNQVFFVQELDTRYMIGLRYTM
ncbi:MAG: TonB-dependent receptor [Halioglobus sp.]